MRERPFGVTGRVPLREIFQGMYLRPTLAQVPAWVIGNSGIVTLLSSETYPQLHDLYRDDRGTFNGLYSAVGRSTARDFREIAKIIYGVEQSVPNIQARFFQLSNGGYDIAHYSLVFSYQPTTRRFEAGRSDLLSYGSR